MEELKIINLSVDGLRRIKAVELKFNENGLTQIIGDNEQGKSTLAIDAIQILIGGNKFANKNIVGTGEAKATIVGQVGPYKVTRVIPKDGTPTLKVVDTRTGEAKTGRVQDFLDSFINELTFNPRPFLSKTKSEKLKFMMDLCKIDFSEIDKQIDIHYNKRKVIGQEIDRYGKIIVPKPVERINTSAIVEQKKKITEANNELYLAHEERKTKELAEIEAFNKEQRSKTNKLLEAKALIDEDKKDIDECNEEIAELELKLKNAKSALLEFKASLDRHETHLKSLSQPLPEKPLVVNIPEPAYQSVDDLDKKLEFAADINQKANEYENQLKRLNEKTKLESERKSESDIIDNLRKEKLAILVGTNTGVEGLTITEEDILYQGISSDNWSDAQGLILSSQLCLAQMPVLKAVFMDRAESIGKKKLAEYEKWALANGIQVIITRVVDEAPKTKDDYTYFIVDGSVAESEEAE